MLLTTALTTAITTGFEVLVTMPTTHVITVVITTVTTVTTTHATVVSPVELSLTVNTQLAVSTIAVRLFVSTVVPTFFQTSRSVDERSKGTQVICFVDRWPTCLSGRLIVGRAQRRVTVRVSWTLCVILSTLTRMPVISTKSARVVAVAMQKGGVGKTTTTINVAFWLAKLGFRVVLLDLDPQANASDGLGVEIGPDDVSMFEVLVEDPDDRVALADAIIESKWGVGIGAAHGAMRKLERYGLGMGGYSRFARQVRELPADFVIIDCPPNLGELTIAALTAAHSVLATVKPGPDEIKGIIELDRSVQEARENLNPDVSIDFVIATMFKKNTLVSADVKSSLEADWHHEYLGEVGDTTRVPESKNAHEPIASFMPELPVSKDYERIAKAIVERMGAHV